MNGGSGRTRRIPDFAKARFVRLGARPGGEIVISRIIHRIAKVYLDSVRPLTMFSCKGGIDVPEACFPTIRPGMLAPHHSPKMMGRTLFRATRQAPDI